MDTTYYILAIILILPGILGAFLPFLPGVPYMFLITLIYGLITKFNTLQTPETLILMVLAIASIITDYLSGLLGAKYGGANKKSLLLGFVGLIIGSLTLPPFGGILGLFLGIFISEIIMHQSHQKAARAATGGLIGSLSGILLNLILSIIFIILFIIFALK